MSLFFFEESNLSSVSILALVATEPLSPDFEQYTRDIGSKLLCQMGYTSGGLVNMDFVLLPIEPEMRPMRVGLGYFEISS